MTNHLFMLNYKNGLLENLSIWQLPVKNKLGDVIGHNEMACFKFEGKFYIRFVFCKGLTRKYHDTMTTAYVKEFTNINSANKYFLKVKSEGYTRVQ